MEEFIQEFLIEGSYRLHQFDRDFVELGKNPASNELLTGIFRTIHTIERTGGAIGLKYRLRKKPIYYMT